MEKKVVIRPDTVLASGFLTVAAIMVLNIVFYKITGAEGAGYMSAPIALFLFGYGSLIITFESVAKEMTRSHYKRGQMNEAKRNINQFLIISSAAGLILSVICAAFSGVFANSIFHSSRSFYILIMTAPLLLFVSIQGVFRGYLAGIGHKSVAVISNLIFVVVSFVLSVVFSGIGYKYGLKVNSLMHVDDIAAVYGAIGASLGIISSCIISLIYVSIMMLIYKSELNNIAEKSMKLKLVQKQSFWDEILPKWIAFGQGGLLLFVDECVYMAVAQRVHAEENNIENWGIYIGQCFAFVIGVTFLTALPFLKSWFAIYIRIAKKEYKVACAKYANLIHFESMLIFPVVIWTMILSGTITAMVFGKTTVSAVDMITLFMPMVIPGAALLFQTFFFVQLRNYLVIAINAVVGLVLHLVLILILSAVAGYGIHAVSLAYLAGIFVQAVLGFVEIKLMLNPRVELVRNVIKPLFAAGISGLICLLIDRLLVNVIGEILTFVIALLLAYLSYMLLLIILKCVNRYELERMPFGDQFAIISDRFEKH